jgi:hypothetical protein
VEKQLFDTDSTLEDAVDDAIFSSDSFLATASNFKMSSASSSPASSVASAKFGLSSILSVDDQESSDVFASPQRVLRSRDLPPEDDDSLPSKLFSPSLSASSPFSSASLFGPGATIAASPSPTKDAKSASSSVSSASASRPWIARAHQFSVATATTSSSSASSRRRAPSSASALPVLPDSVQKAHAPNSSDIESSIQEINPSNPDQVLTERQKWKIEKFGPRASLFSEDFEIEKSEPASDQSDPTLSAVQIEEILNPLRMLVADDENALSLLTAVSDLMLNDCAAPVDFGLIPMNSYA